MTPLVTVVDYGMGNLFSVARAVEHCGARVALAETPEALRDAERVILPGVGAFPDGLGELKRRGLDEALRAYAAGGRPLLGICLGMQMLLDASEDFGAHAGLGVIRGNVTPIPATSADGAAHKIPHIGWNRLMPASSASWERTLLEGIPSGESAYFVHSFAAFPADPKHRLADCDYDGRAIPAVIRKENVTGCQFHPEKSASAGLKMLANFILS
jgi:glutamine amidotransferase